MAQFPMLPRDTQASSDPFTPDSAEATIEDYKAWSHKMGGAGKLVGGNKLQ